MKNKVIEYINKKYAARPEYLWQKDPDSAIWRHDDNKKWFAILMFVSRDRLGFSGDGKVFILNLRLSDLLAVDLVTQREGIIPAYHMQRGRWISVILDGTVPLEEIAPLIDESYGCTMSKAKKNKTRPPKEWILPSNPSYYDIVGDFARRNIIEWKQAAGVKVGDTVYMYVGAPISAILYKCTVVELDIPYNGKSEKVRIKSLMRIKLERKYPPDRFTFKRLGEEFSIFAVRGPRGVPEMLSAALNLEE